MSTDTATRWALTLQSLAGEPPPPMPELPGRRFGLPTEIPTVAQDAQAQDSELAAAQVWQALADDHEGSTLD